MSCDYLVHEIFVDPKYLDSCYDRYHLGSESATAVDTADDPPYPSDIIDCSGDTSMLLRAAPE